MIQQFYYRVMPNEDDKVVAVYSPEDKSKKLGDGKSIIAFGPFGSRSEAWIKGREQKALMPEKQQRPR